MDSARPETPLGNLESPALPQQDVGDGDPDVGELNLRVAVWGILEAEDTEGSQHCRQKTVSSP